MTAFSCPSEQHSATAVTPSPPAYKVPVTEDKRKAAKISSAGYGDQTMDVDLKKPHMHKGVLKLVQRRVFMLERMFGRSYSSKVVDQE